MLDGQGATPAWTYVLPGLTFAQCQPEPPLLAASVRHPPAGRLLATRPQQAALLSIYSRFGACLRYPSAAYRLRRPSLSASLRLHARGFHAAAQHITLTF